VHTNGVIPAAQRDGLTERPPLRARSASPPAVRVWSAALRRSLLAVCRVLLLVASALLVVWVIHAPFVAFEVSFRKPGAAPPAATRWADLSAFLAAWGPPALVLTLVVAALALATRQLGLPWREEE